MKKKFICNKDFILNNCHGECCFSKNKLYHNFLKEESEYFKKTFPREKMFSCDLNKKRKCLYQTSENLCSLYKEKIPLGCYLYPLTFNKNNTLIIRHRALMFKCYNQGDFVYITFKYPLIKLFGEVNYQYMVKKLEESNEDFYIDIDDNIFKELTCEPSDIFFNVINV